MRTGYQSFAYWMRRSTGMTAAELTPFYEDVVGLPVIRDLDPAVLFWAGEDLVFEIKCDDEPDVDATDPATATTTPLFRSYDLAATEERLAAAGYPVVGRESGEHSETIWILGPDRLLTGFQSRSETSPWAADAEALARWNRPAVAFDGLPALPPDLQYLHRVRRRAADVEALAAHYRDVVGLDEVGREDGSVLLDLGDTVILEIAPGGSVDEVPEDRTSLPDGFILRMRYWDDFVAGLTASGAVFAGGTAAYSTGTMLAYLADPEGNLVGIEERTQWGDYPEDLEADRRWLELVEAGAPQVDPKGVQLRPIPNDAPPADNA
ncbi:VOC family protein [Frondihabitans cladoniiphilus]|uniref:Uncharacterized protein n=1 Tax=Frondihabitans cladoniiphilus TaxID=715785 RepID=A0ABP8W4D2_9MICO